MLTELTDNSPLESALYYLSLGWRVFPIHEMTGGRCSCGHACKSPGKHPRLMAGLNSATSNSNDVTKWFGYWPNMNLGVVTGSASGLVAVDIDPDKGGDYAFELIEDDLPETVKQITGSGGFHLLYKLPEGVKVKNAVDIDDGHTLKLSGVDIRGEGGFIVVPPSNHESGNGYRWEDDYSPEDQELTEIPLAFLERFNLIKPDLPEVATVGDIIAYALDRDSIVEIKSALEAISPDGRDDWLRVGMALHSTGAGSQAFDLWDEWSQKTEAGNYDPRSQVSSWTAFKPGARNIESLFFLAYSNGWEGAQTEPLTIIDDLGLLEPARFIDNSVEMIESGKLVEIRPGVLSQSVDAEEVGEDDEPDFAPSLADLLQARSGEVPDTSKYSLWNDETMIKDSIVLIAGEPKVGKSEFVLSMSMAAANGTQWMNAPFNGKYSVLWLNAELKRDYVIKRVAKYRDQIDGDTRFYSTAKDEFPNRRVPDLTSKAGLAYLKRLAKRKKPDIVIVDPLANWTIGSDENKSNDVITAIGNICAVFAGATVVIVHHLKKGDISKKSPDFDDIRGSGALRGLYDTGFLLYKNAENVRVKFECRHAKAPDDFELTRDTDGKLKPLFSNTDDGRFSGFQELTEQDRIERDHLQILQNIITDAGGSVSRPQAKDALVKRCKFSGRTADKRIELAYKRGEIDFMSDPNHKQRQVIISTIGGNDDN
ncbi:bifunctional DNA primase/polymerase [Endozoicomonas acroporae]|uniref:bifunctional DNA primase/polymerase n=1 Tax=Endozoicomonas acroporae TaxID=1701104 RepID=UPI0013D0288D|nr:bifunctional DNA primase/polymerase [Endozoicomonas acroporae]